ncbi:MAG: oxidoreductase [Isosphaeraceae bacterium]|jgi:nucleoside-diphosphate-sugar epimerase|nr:MAG: oxidoreductase [Isosphaeraceae bacterium]
MPESVSLVTGATGLLGSHLAEQLVARGHSVRALVRPTSQTGFLQRLGVELVLGDLTDVDACRRAVRGVRLVFHAAAKVGDWGRWEEFQRDCLEATERLAQAACDAGIERFVHISSTSAYGHPPEGGPPLDETAPLGQNLWPVWDDYTRSKVLCEQILWRMAQRDGLPLTVLRPSWLYGERDRTTTARLVRRLRRGGIPLIGPGDNPLSAIYAGCVADAAISAATHPAARGQAYNVTDQGPITQLAFFDLWARALGVQPSRRRFSYPLVFAAAWALEATARLTRSRHPPTITRYATWLMGRNLAYSSAKIRNQLGWTHQIEYPESIARTVAWFTQQNGSRS